MLRDMTGKLVRYNLRKAQAAGYKATYPEFHGCVGLVTHYTPVGKHDGKEHATIDWVNPRPKRGSVTGGEIFSSHFSLDRFDVIGE